MAEYRVQLDVYNGPLDLLLYLIRREEVDIYDIPIAHITDQYLSYVRLLEQLDPDAAAEFLVMAATLMEIKSRMLLPRPEPEQDEQEVVDPRLELVRQLLEYKKFKDVASGLASAAQRQALRFPRPPTELPDQTSQVDLEEVQVWDLLAAFQRLLASIGQTRPSHEVVYDDTPVLLHAADILDRLQREGGSLTFDRIFEGRTRAEMIGLFLALLELIRQQRVRAQQERTFGAILVVLLDPTPLEEESAEPELHGSTPTGAARLDERGEFDASETRQVDLDEEDPEIRAIDEAIDEIAVDVPFQPDEPQDLDRRNELS